MNYLKQRIKDVGHTPLLGVTVHTYNPAFVEMAGMLGFDVLWIEMEHMHNTFDQACELCRVAAGVGLLTMVRVPDSKRESVLKAAECGPHIIDLPMGNSAEVLNEFVSHARFPPAGKRGFFSCSRALRYGIYDSIQACQDEINQNLCLMSQVETKEAVEKLDEICAVQGIDGIFIGPGDLSASMGLPGGTTHVATIDAINHTIDSAKSAGKLVALAYSIADYRSSLSKNVDLLFCASDLSCIRSGLMDVRTSAENLQSHCVEDIIK